MIINDVVVVVIIIIFILIQQKVTNINAIIVGVM
jgi:hypothetical protein